jgi:hypothetical protein
MTPGSHLFGKTSSCAASGWLASGHPSADVPTTKQTSHKTGSNGTPDYYANLQGPRGTCNAV